MGDIVVWLIFLVIVAALVVAGAWFLRTQVSGNGKSLLFRPKPEKRLAFVEQMTLDSRRKMVLVRRDGVEHLIMVGGPVDVVVETGIRVEGGDKALPTAEAREISPPVFTRQPRTLGQTGTE